MQLIPGRGLSAGCPVSSRIRECHGQKIVITADHDNGPWKIPAKARLFTLISIEEDGANTFLPNEQIVPG